MGETPNLGLAKPDRGDANWDMSMNKNFDILDEAIGAVNALENGKIIVGSAAGVATDVSMNGDITIDNSGNTTIGADKVTNPKLANMNQGTVKVGGVGNVPTNLDASGNTKILVGDGTDINSVAVSGDITITNAGVVIVGNDKITSAKIVPTYMKVTSGNLIADVSGNMAFYWQNPEDAKILVHRTIIDITTAGGAAGSLLDVGTVDASGNTSDNLIDGLDLNNADASDNISDGGTNGRSIQKLDENGGTTDWITGKILVEDANSLAGKYYIFYTEGAA